MAYTIGQAAKKTGLTISTIRYYDKEGLLPFVKRTESGIRQFDENDIEWLLLICCLKNSNMPLEQIKIFINWCMEGDATLKQRLDMFVVHKMAVRKNLEQLYTCLDTIDYKIWYYATSYKAGTELAHQNHHWGRYSEEFFLAKEDGTLDKLVKEYHAD